MITYNELIKSINILLADDDEDYLEMTYAFLKQFGYNVDKVSDGKQAIEAINKKDYQILLLDFFMPGLNGEEVVNEIRKTNKQLIIILQTGFSGQKPPIETMQKLDIQNYYDKTEGIGRLNLELISAVKIFSQQNEIQLTKYKDKAIGGLITGLAQEIKSNLLSVGASLELTNMMLKEKNAGIEKEDLEKLNKFYVGNKSTLSRVDKVLTSIIRQSTENSDYIMQDSEIIEIMDLVLKNESRDKGINVETSMSLKNTGYLKGGVNDSIYIICEIVKELMKFEEKGSTIKIVLTDDEQNWYFNITSSVANKLSNSFIYLIKKVIVSVANTSILFENDKVVLSIQKNA